MRGLEVCGAGVGQSAFVPVVSSLPPPSPLVSFIRSV